MRGRQKICLPPTLIFFLSFSFLGTLPSLGQHPTSETGPPPKSLPLLSIPPSHHLSSRCHVVDEFNQKLICHWLENTLWEWEHPVRWHVAKTVPGCFVCVWVSWGNLCHEPERSRFNGSAEVNKVVPVAFVIYNTLSISASGDLDSPCSTGKDSQRLPDAK